MKLTTGYDFQGYYITEYLDVIFDEMLVGLGLGKSLIAGLDNIFSALSGSEATEMIDKLNDVKYQLRERVIAKASKLGANALIGIDFESSKLGDLIMVSMTATAVKIDKIVSPLPLTQTENARLEEERASAEKAREKQQLMEQFLQNPDGFTIGHFWETLSGLDTVQEMISYLETTLCKHPDLLDGEVMKKVKNCGKLERLYGKSVGRQEVLKIVKGHIGL